MNLSRLAAAVLAPLALAAGASAQEQHPAMQAAERIRAEVAAMRGLEYQAPVRVGVKSPAQIREMILSEFETESPAEELAKQEKVFKRLGLIPADYELRAKLIDFLSEQIGGYYDPEEKELFLVDQSQNPEMQALGPAQRFMDEMVMAHELHHALQDQNFDLTRWFELLISHDDRIQGYKSLVEGEAQLIGMQYLFKKMGRGDVDIAQFNRMQEMAARFSPEAAKLREIPPFLIENMMFPYTQGAEFVQRMQREHGWARISAAFDDPPTSTEQVLHPEKFLGEQRDEPMELILPDLSGALGEGAEELYENTLGEFNVTLLLRALGLSKGEAARAAAGWDGDRFKGYETRDGRTVVVWLSTWDSEAEAREFEAAYAKATRGAPDRRVERRGLEVLLLDGAQDGELAALTRRGFAALKYEPRFVPLAGMTGRPPREDFTAEAAPAVEAPAAEAPATPRAATLLRSESVGATYAPPEGYSPIEEPNENLRQMGAATLQGPGGERIRMLRLPVALGQADEQIKALLTQGVPDVEVRGQDRTRVLGRDALWIDFVGTLPGDRTRSQNRALLIDMGADSLAVGASVPDGQAGSPQQAIEGLVATLWLDGTARPGALPATAGPIRFEAPEGFVQARARQGDAILCTLEHATGAKVQVVRTPIQGSLEDRARALEAQLPLALEGFRARSAGLITRQGRPAHELDFEAGGRRTRQVTVDVDGQRYTIACSAPADRFGEHLAAFGRALATFAVSAETPAAPSDKPDQKPERRPY